MGKSPCDRLLAIDDRACKPALAILWRYFGDDPTCPARFAVRFGLSGSWAFWERVDTAFIDVCRELWVYQLAGWEESVGVQAEVAYANRQQKHVRYLDVTENLTG